MSIRSIKVLMLSLAVLLAIGGTVFLIWTVEGICSGSLELASRQRSIEVQWRVTPKVFMALGACYVAVALAALWGGWRMYVYFKNPHA